MTAELALPRSVEKSSSVELIREAHGLGVIILHAQTGEVLTIEETVDKPSTGRRRGQRSIPLETAKRIDGEKEEPLPNLHGALAEVLNDRDLHGNDVRHILKKSLHHVKDHAFHQGIRVRMGPRTIVCGYAITFYNGPAIAMEPFNAAEARNPLWLPIDSILNEEVPIRSLAREVVQEAWDSGILEENWRRYHTDEDSRVRTLPADFSIQQKYELRELHPDMVA
jgi:hypothetical protein